MGSANAEGKFADVGASEWIEALRRELAPLMISFGIPDFDASVLQGSGLRFLTHTCVQFRIQTGIQRHSVLVEIRT